MYELTFPFRPFLLVYYGCTRMTTVDHDHSIVGVLERRIRRFHRSLVVSVSAVQVILVATIFLFLVSYDYNQ